MKATRWMRRLSLALLLQLLLAGLPLSSTQLVPLAGAATTTDARGNQTSYGYDSKGNLTGITPPAPLGAISISPDSLSRVHTRTDGKNQTTTYTYDPIDRVTNIAYADSTSIGYAYDGAGNRTSMTDGTGTTTWAYDPQNRQTSKSSPQAGNFTYGYDAIGNLTTLAGAAGTTTYGYNNLNELTSLLDWDSTTTTFGYDANHHRTSTSYPNGVVMTTSYDNSQRIASIVSAKSGSTLTSFAYSYTNPANNHDAMLEYGETENDPTYNNTTTSGYDAVNRLTDFKISGSISHEYQYQYDGNGNRTSQTETVNGTPNTTTYSYNNANEITSAGPLAYSFDANGNELGSTLSGSSVLSFTYNAKNQTTNITGNNTTDPNNNQDMAYTGPAQAERLTAGVRSFTYSGVGMYQETNSTSYTESTALVGGGTVSQSVPQGTVTFTHDPSGQLIGEILPGGTKNYYLLDGHNSVRALVDSNGTVQAQYVYCPGGNVVGQSPTSAPFNPWRQGSGYKNDDSGTQMGYALEIGDKTIDRPNEMGYQFDWSLGLATGPGSSEFGMLAFQASPGEVFPFSLGQCTIIALGEQCGLQTGPSGDAPVEVTGQTTTSFTFTALPGHFDNPGSTITFSLYQLLGHVFLEQTAVWVIHNAWDEVREHATVPLAYVNWRQQAANLTNLLNAAGLVQ